MSLEPNKLELIDSKENTCIKINGQEINKVQGYKLERNGIDLNLELRISIDESQSTIDIRREYGTIKV